MTTVEHLLGVAKLYQERGEPIPLDILVEADSLGLSMSLFGLPHNTNLDEGELTYGNEAENNTIQDA